MYRKDCVVSQLDIRIATFQMYDSPLVHYAAARQKVMHVRCVKGASDMKSFRLTMRVDTVKRARTFLANTMVGLVGRLQRDIGGYHVGEL